MRRSCSFATRPSFTALVKRKKGERERESIFMSCLFLFYSFNCYHFAILALFRFSLFSLDSIYTSTFILLHIYFHTHSALYSFRSPCILSQFSDKNTKNPKKPLCMIFVYVFFSCGEQMCFRFYRPIDQPALTHDHRLLLYPACCASKNRFSSKPSKHSSKQISTGLLQVGIHCLSARTA